MDGNIVKEIGENVGLQYYKSKKVAMVSSRDQYIVTSVKQL